MTESQWTFAYGSNMDTEDVEAWFARHGHRDAQIERAEPATLPGYRLVWNYFSTSRGGGAANVERADEQLPGVALLVNRDALSAFDKKEGHPAYYSRGAQRVPVQLAGGTLIDAWLYVVVPHRCRPTTVLPTRAYLNILIRAAERFNLPRQHVEMLRATQTLERSDV